MSRRSNRPGAVVGRHPGALDRMVCYRLRTAPARRAGFLSRGQHLARQACALHSAVQRAYRLECLRRARLSGQVGLGVVDQKSWPSRWPARPARDLEPSRRPVSVPRTVADGCGLARRDPDFPRPPGSVRPIMMVLEGPVARGDLSEVEWERLKPLLPTDYRRVGDSGITARSSTGSRGSSGPERRGGTCPNGAGRGRPATNASGCGPPLAPGRG